MLMEDGKNAQSKPTVKMSSEEIFHNSLPQCAMYNILFKNKKYQNFCHPYILKQDYLSRNCKFLISHIMSDLFLFRSVYIYFIKMLLFFNILNNRL